MVHPCLFQAVSQHLATSVQHERGAAYGLHLVNESTGRGVKLNLVSKNLFVFHHQQSFKIGGCSLESDV